jgi:hypothetical protein
MLGTFLSTDPDAIPIMALGPENIKVEDPARDNASQPAQSKTLEGHSIDSSAS